jgi:putative tricarboxylic transport membrane protein
MVAVGLFVSVIGIDPQDSQPRFTLGLDQLMLGVEFLPLAMGFFGVAEILSIAVEGEAAQAVTRVRLKELLPTSEERRRAAFPMLRGSILGFFVGLIPGPCTVISTFLAYSLEKRVSTRPEQFGLGAVEGVVAPEAANNSAVMGSMIPLLTLGIPFAAPAAVLLAGLRMHHVEPGPLLFQNNPDVFWTFIAAMYVGNFMLLVLNLPLVGLFARIAAVRPKFLMPFVSAICLVGVYSVRNSLFDVWVMIAAGVLGFALRKWEYPVTAFIIGIVLGPTTESSLRQTLMMFKGSVVPILDRPIALSFLGLSVLFAIGKWGFTWFRGPDSRTARVT